MDTFFRKFILNQKKLGDLHKFLRRFSVAKEHSAVLKKNSQRTFECYQISLHKLFIFEKLWIIYLEILKYADAGHNFE